MADKGSHSADRSKVDELIADFKVIDHLLLHTNFNNKSSQILTFQAKVRDIHQKALLLHLSYMDDAFYADDYHSTHDPDAIVRLLALLKLIEIASKFLNNQIKTDQLMTMRRLTLITTLCLPLSIITGFFGMNFGFMGVDKGSSGILRSRNAPRILALSFGAAIVLVLAIFRLRLI